MWSTWSVLIPLCSHIFDNDAILIWKFVLFLKFSFQQISTPCYRKNYEQDNIYDEALKLKSD